jgi:hypothetical protein
MGATHLVSSRGDFHEQVKALTGGRGADVVFDPVGGDVFDRSTRCIGFGGRLLVIGFGERKTPKPFVAACDRFLYTDLLRRGGGRRAAAEPHDEGAPPLKPFLCEAISAVTQDDGWAPLGMVGSLLQKNDPSFDARSYGFRKLSELVKGQPYLTVKEVPVSPGSPQMHLFVQTRGS